MAPGGACGRMDECAGDALRAAVGAAGLDALPTDIERCAAVAAWIGERGSALGLTQFSTGHSVAANLIAPGIALTPYVRSRPAVLAEIGAGSGALGVGLGALFPQLEVRLIERRERAAGFIDLTIRRFRLENCVAIREDVRVHGCAYEAVVARAVSRSEALLLQIARVCATGGCVAVIRSVARRSIPDCLHQVAHLETCVAGLVVDVYRKDEPGSGCAGARP